MDFPPEAFARTAAQAGRCFGATPVGPTPVDACKNQGDVRPQNDRKRVRRLGV